MTHSDAVRTVSWLAHCRDPGFLRPRWWWSEESGCSALLSAMGLLTGGSGGDGGGTDSGTDGAGANPNWPGFGLVMGPGCGGGCGGVGGGGWIELMKL
ncbi:MAG TPA: hypothetical protein VMO78_15735 [Rhizomicrobium sp.]|nr:hypothetical protein [Rhizomicrobium sp.]